MTAWIRRAAIAATLLPVALGGCKIPPWDETEGSLAVRQPLEAAIPWGKTCAIDIHGRPGLLEGGSSRRNRDLANGLKTLRRALLKELAMVGVFKETVEAGASDYRLTIEVQESEKRSLSVSVTLLETRMGQPLAAFDVVGYAGPFLLTGDVAPFDSTAHVTAFWITLGLDYRRKKT